MVNLNVIYLNVACVLNEKNMNAFALCNNNNNNYYYITYCIALLKTEFTKCFDKTKQEYKLLQIQRTIK